MNKYEALRVVNKKAKQYKESNEEYLRERGDALYKLKHRAINSWCDDFEETAKHIINGDEFYCFYVDDYSFHIPKEEVYVDVQVTEKENLGNFKSSRVQDTGYSEKQALEYLNSHYSMNANGFLSDNAPAQSTWGFLESFGL